MGAEDHLRASTKLYGLTPADYRRMLTAQGNRCAICGCDPTNQSQRFSIDHDHVTGRVRGLLCNRCNRALGLLRDDATILERARRYLDATAPVAPR